MRRLRIKSLFFKSNENQRGFTLVDLTVSAIILIVILSFVLANFRGANRNNLNLALQKLTADIKDVQIKSLAGQAIGVCQQRGMYLCRQEDLLGLPLRACNPDPNKDPSGPCPAGYICHLEPAAGGIFCGSIDATCLDCRQTFPTGGYGLSFEADSRKIYLFADVDDDNFPIAQNPFAEREYTSEAPVEILKGNYLDRICYSTDPAPQVPPIRQNSTCADGWYELSINAFNYIAVVTFKEGQTSIRIKLSVYPYEEISGVTYLGLSLYNERANQRAYLLIPRGFSLINADILK